MLSYDTCQSPLRSPALHCTVPRQRALPALACLGSRAAGRSGQTCQLLVSRPRSLTKPQSRQSRLNAAPQSENAQSPVADVSSELYLPGTAANKVQLDVAGPVELAALSYAKFESYCQRSTPKAQSAHKIIDRVPTGRECFTLDPCDSHRGWSHAFSKPAAANHLSAGSAFGSEYASPLLNYMMMQSFCHLLPDIHSGCVGTG